MNPGAAALFEAALTRGAGAVEMCLQVGKFLDAQGPSCQLRQRPLSRKRYVRSGRTPDTRAAPKRTSGRPIRHGQDGK
jgi:hypothetical protein